MRLLRNSDTQSRGVDEMMRALFFKDQSIGYVWRAVGPATGTLVFAAFESPPENDSCRDVFVRRLGGRESYSLPYVLVNIYT